MGVHVPLLLHSPAPRLPSLLFLYTLPTLPSPTLPHFLNTRTLLFTPPCHCLTLLSTQIHIPSDLLTIWQIFQPFLPQLPPPPARLHTLVLEEALWLQETMAMFTSRQAMTMQSVLE